MRLVDADALRDYWGMDRNGTCEKCKYNYYKDCQYSNIPRSDVCSSIDDAPTVDAVPVKHGAWVAFDTSEAYDIAGVKTWALKARCSKCGFTSKFIEAHTAQYNYCPNCGAKMDGER